MEKDLSQKDRRLREQVSGIKRESEPRYLVSMDLGTRDSIVAYTEALREGSGEPDGSGLPTVCPLVLARGLYESSLRWESICRRAVKILDHHSGSVQGEEPCEALKAAEEEAENIARSLI